MGRIYISEAAINGIKFDKKEKPVYSEEYKKLQEQADKRIAEHRHEQQIAKQKIKNETI